MCSATAARSPATTRTGSGQIRHQFSSAFPSAVTGTGGSTARSCSSSHRRAAGSTRSTRCRQSHVPPNATAVRSASRSCGSSAVQFGRRQAACSPQPQRTDSISGEPSGVGPTGIVTPPPATHTMIAYHPGRQSPRDGSRSHTRAVRRAQERAQRPLLRCCRQTTSPSATSPKALDARPASPPRAGLVRAPGGGRRLTGSRPGSRPASAPTGLVGPACPYRCSRPPTTLR